MKVATNSIFKTGQETLQLCLSNKMLNFIGWSPYQAEEAILSHCFLLIISKLQKTAESFSKTKK
jgi:hypothetical protein